MRCVLWIFLFLVPDVRLAFASHLSSLRHAVFGGLKEVAKKVTMNDAKTLQSGSQLPLFSETVLQHFGQPMPLNIRQRSIKATPAQDRKFLNVRSFADLAKTD